jgi:hypothetical protein
MDTTSLRKEQLAFDMALREVIVPKNQSDRTSFRNISNWLVERCQAGIYDEGIFRRVLGYAVEAAGPSSRNPAAVFTAILKKELDYHGKEKEEEKGLCQLSQRLLSVCSQASRGVRTAPRNRRSVVPDGAGRRLLEF